MDPGRIHTISTPQVMRKEKLAKKLNDFILEVSKQ